MKLVYKHLESKKLTTLILIVSISLGCTNKVDILNLQNKKAQYYYCAFLGDALDFNIGNKVNSIAEFDNYLELLNRLDVNSDANYYKLVNNSEITMLYGYSMKTKELKELITLSSKTKRLLSEETFISDKAKKCEWTYLDKKDKSTVAIKHCTDDSKSTMSFDYSKEKKRHVLRKYVLYKSNKLVKELFYDENGIAINHKEEGSVYDTCIPYRAYRIEK